MLGRSGANIVKTGAKVIAINDASAASSTRRASTLSRLSAHQWKFLRDYWQEFKRGEQMAMRTF